jgi:hypothetical protein
MGMHQSNKVLQSKGNRVERQTTEWEKISASYTFDSALIIRIYKGLEKLNSQESTTQ